MERAASSFMIRWLLSTDRRPLVIRGARQVGKTWLVRHLAESQGRDLIEINLEKRPDFATLLTSNDPSQILLNLSDSLNRTIEVDKSILFFDEIQAMPEILAKLRWFAEDMPELPVIAAGSLLEFVLAKHSFSMPVGRINYMHLEPLSFEEFLMAHNKSGLLRFLSSFEWHAEIPRAIHDQLMMLVKEYIIIGGMPLAVSSWLEKKSLQDVDQKHLDLLATYRDDFAKYGNRISPEQLDKVMMAVPKHLSEKFVYTKVDPDTKAPYVKKALDLLYKARICHSVTGTDANGIPLAAEINTDYRKVIFLDVGLCSTALGLSLNELYAAHEIDLINKGGIAEQIVGQTLRTIEPPYRESSLYYWDNPKKGSEAEIDYVMHHGSKVIPIQVKAGKTGTLKSLHLFMGLKKKSLAVRINSDIPTVTKVQVKDHERQPINYTLLSLPFYLMGQLHRLLDAHLQIASR